MKDWKHLLYMGLTLAMLIYAIPQLSIGQGITLPTVFGIVWIAFALLVVSAHLHRLLRVDEETKQQLEQVKLYRRRQREQWLRRKLEAVGRKS